jgi:hypothetical protein
MALLAEEQIVRRDRRVEQFLASNRRNAELEAERGRRG